MKRKSNKSPVAILGFDPHLSKDNVTVVRDLFNQTFALAEEIGCKIVILGGDVFTSRSAQPLEVLDAWREITEEAEARGLEIAAIPGNHDKTDPNSDRSYLSVCPGAAMSTGTWYLKSASAPPLRYSTLNTAAWA